MDQYTIIHPTAQSLIDFARERGVKLTRRQAVRERNAKGEFIYLAVDSLGLLALKLSPKYVISDQAWGINLETGISRDWLHAFQGGFQGWREYEGRSGYEVGEELFRLALKAGMIDERMKEE